MNIFYIKKRFLIFFILLLIGGIGLKLINKNRTNPLFFVLEIQTAVVNLKMNISNLLEKYLFLLNLQEKNRDLKKKNTELKVRYQAFEENRKENRRLKQLLKFSSSPSFQLLPAQVAGTDLLARNQIISINKGRKHGVRKFMGVLHPEGVIGYVFRTGPHSSQVISLLNPLSSLPARNQRSRINGLISPGENNSLSFRYFDQNFLEEEAEKFQAGDRIVTTKSDQFPAGFLVGRIVSVSSSVDNMEPRIQVQPAVRFSSLEEVLIIIKNPPPSPKKTNEWNNELKN